MYFFDYALIRYMPDVKRGEIFNIGLIVFKPSGIDLRVLPVAHRLLHNVDEIKLQSLQKSWEFLASVVETTQERFELLSTATQNVFLSEKAYFSINQINEYELKVQHLFDVLVQPVRTKREIQNHNARFYTSIKTQFKALKILADNQADIESHKVVTHYAINSDMDLFADFALKNGRLHVTQTVDFNVNDTKAKQKETGLKLLTFLQSKKLIENPACYFVYSASVQKEREIVHQLNMVNEYTDQLFNFDSQDERKRYFYLMNNLAMQSTTGEANLSILQ